MLASIMLACTLVAVDGDTLRCGKERIRLIGIDAPELPGHCAAGRRCVQGDPWESKAALQRMLKGAAKIERFGFDRYRRTLAVVTVNGRDVACQQLAAGAAIYVAKWDTAGVARRCSRGGT